MWMGQCDAPAALPQERGVVPIVEEAGWAPGPVWTNIETIKSLPPTWVQTIDHPGSSNLLYQLYAALIISALFLERLKFNFAFRKWYPVGHLLEYVTGLQFPQNSSGQSLIYSTSIPILPLSLYSDPSSVFLHGIWEESGSPLNEHRLT
jgi:hypothetical protein